MFVTAVPFFGYSGPVSYVFQRKTVAQNLICLAFYEIYVWFSARSKVHQPQTLKPKPKP